MTDAAATVALLERLVGIDSVNPELVPGGAGELAVRGRQEPGRWGSACGPRWRLGWAPARRVGS